MDFYNSAELRYSHQLSKLLFASLKINIYYTIWAFLVLHHFSKHIQSRYFTITNAFRNIKNILRSSNIRNSLDIEMQKKKNTKTLSRGLVLFLSSIENFMLILPRTIFPRNLKVLYKYLGKLFYAL